MNRHLGVTLLLAVLLVPAAQAQVPESLLRPEHLRAAHLLRLNSPLALTSSAAPSRLDETWFHIWDEVQWSQRAKTIFVYDGTRRIEEWTYDWNGTALVNDTRLTRTFSAGVVTEELHETWNGEAFVPETQTVYTYYSPLPVPAKMLERRWIPDGGWVSTEQTTYTHERFTDPITNISVYLIVGGETDTLAGTSWTPVERFTIVQDGEDAVFTTEIPDGAEWVGTERARYLNQTIPEIHALLREFEQRFTDYGGTYLSLSLPDFVTQEWDGTQWVDQGRQITTFEYDWQSGQISRATTTTETWIEDTWVAEMRSDVTYEPATPASRPHETVLQFLDGETWATFATETYEYNANGDLEDATQQADYGEGLQDVAWFYFLWRTPSTSVDDEPLPQAYVLDAAYPNPFNPTTQLTFHLAAPGPAAVRVYDALGRLVATLADGTHTAGPHGVVFDAAGLPSGPYFVRLEAPEFHQTRSVMLLK